MSSSPRRSQTGEPPVVVQVWSDGALFTRPEFRVERLSYSVMTPTAAVGVLESIFWKPEFRWVPVAIDVLRPIEQFTLRRNETHDLPSLADAVGKGRRINTSENRGQNRDQRNAVCLKNVAYRIHAQVELYPHATKTAAAYRDQFRRRVTRGASFQHPYLGTREFPANFGPADDATAIPVTGDLGIMIHRVHHGPPVAFDWFSARIDNGTLHVPAVGIRADVPVAG